MIEAKVAKNAPRSRRHLAPADPALPTAVGLPSVAGSPRRHAPAGRRGENRPALRGLSAAAVASRPGGREFSNQSLLCSHITSYGKRRRLRGSQRGLVQMQPRRDPLPGDEMRRPTSPAQYRLRSAKDFGLEAQKGE